MVAPILTSKLHAAMHEAGHTAVAAVHGFPSGARIWMLRKHGAFSGECFPLGNVAAIDAEMSIAGAVAVAIHNVKEAGGRCQQAAIVSTVMVWLSDRSNKEL